MATSPSVYDQLGKIIRSSKNVRKAVEAKQKRVVAEAERIAAAEAPEVKIGTAEGVRPGTHAKDNAPRMFARIEAPMDQEFGTKFVEIRRILGRSRDA
jgi:hypothetical protein